MNWSARLMITVAASWALCAAMQAEPIRLLPGPGQSWPRQFREGRYFTAPGGTRLIEADRAAVSERPGEVGDPTSFYTVSLENLLLNLIRPDSASVVRPEAESDADGAEKNPYVVGSAPGFYNPEVWQAQLESRLMVPLDVMLPLLGGPLLFDTLADPHARFAVQPDTGAEAQAAMLAIAAQQSGAGGGSILERLRFTEIPEKALLVLLGFGLALLPALLRSLKYLTRFLPALPARLKRVVTMLRRPVYSPQQIKPVETETENPMPKRRRVVASKDESWRKRPPVRAERVSARTELPSPSVPAELSVSAAEITPEADRQAAVTATSPGPVSRAQARRDKETQRPAATAKVVTRIYRIQSPPAVATEAAVAESRAVSSLPAKTVESEARPVLPRREEPIQDRPWRLPETDDDHLITRIEYDPLFSSRAVSSGSASPEPKTNYNELRTGVMLAWLEDRIPSLVEAVAWEDEHLGEYRGLPFADALTEEHKAGNGTQTSERT